MDALDALTIRGYWRVARGLFIEESAFVKAPGSTVVQVEVAIATEVFAREILTVFFGNQALELFVRQQVELIGTDSPAYA
jgi:hypothetical protein